MSRDNPRVRVEYRIRCGLPQLSEVHTRIHSEVKDYTHQLPGLIKLQVFMDVKLRVLQYGSQVELMRLCPYHTRDSEDVFHAVMAAWATDGRSERYRWTRPDPAELIVPELKAELADLAQRHAAVTRQRRAELEQAIEDARRFVLTQALLDEQVLAAPGLDRAAVTAQLAQQRLEAYGREDAAIRQQITSIS